MAGIQILDPLRVDYSDANALVQSGLKALMDSPIPFQTQINANQTRLDNDTLGLIQEMSMKYAPGTPEFEAGRANILMNNPNAYVPEQSIVTAGQTGIETRQKNESGILTNEGLGITNANNLVQGQGYALDNTGKMLGNIGQGIQNEEQTWKLDTAKRIQAEIPVVNEYIRTHLPDSTATPEEKAAAAQRALAIGVTDMSMAHLKLGEMSQAYTNMFLGNQVQNRQVDVQEGNLAVNAYQAANPISGSGGGGDGAVFPYPQSTSNSGGNSYAGVLQHGESRRDGYNATNRGARHGYKSGSTDASNTTVGQVLANMRSGNYKAFGRYQFHEISFPGAVRALPWLKMNTKMTPEVQDRIMAEYYVTKKQPAIGNYISGKSNNLRAAVDASAAEWRSMKNSKGRIHEADGINKASVGPERTGAALTLARKAYSAAIAQGMNSNVAMRVALTNPDAVLKGTAAGEIALANYAGKVPPTPPTIAGVGSVLTNKPGNALAIAKMALETGAADRQARLGAQAVGQPGVEQLLGPENMEHFIKYAKSRNIGSTAFLSMSKKEQKSLLEDYTDYLSDTAKKKHEAVDRVAKGRFLAAKDIPEALTKLADKYAVANSSEEFKDGKKSLLSSDKKNAANLNPYNQGTRVIARLLVNAKNNGSLKVYDNMLNPTTLDKAITSGLAEYEAYLAKTLSGGSNRINTSGKSKGGGGLYDKPTGSFAKGGKTSQNKDVIPLFGRSDYAITRFKNDGYIHDMDKFTEIITKHFNNQVGIEKDIRTGGVAAVDTLAGWSGDIKNIRAALKNL